MVYLQPTCQIESTASGYGCRISHSWEFPLPAHDSSSSFKSLCLSADCVRERRHNTMDVSSIRSLITLVIQLHTIAISAQALSSQTPQTKSKKSPGDLTPRPSNKSCCLNGGLCVLGSFCHCPKKFYGRYCEYELSEKPCGPVPHGNWVKAGCNLCRCFDSHMTCLPRAFDGCDDKPLTEEQPENIWDYQDEMVIFANQGTTTSKYDAEDADYYDYYDDGGGGRDGDGGGGRHSTGARLVPGLRCVAVCIVVCVLVTILWTSWTLVS